MMPPPQKKMFLTTVLGDLILIYGASKKVTFDSLCYLVLPQQRVCQGVLKIF